MGKFNQHNIRAAKMTPSTVREVREFYMAGRTQGQLARQYGISIGQVGRIVRGEAWNQFDNPIVDPAEVPPASSEDIRASEDRLRKLMGEE